MRAVVCHEREIAMPVTRRETLLSAGALAAAGVLPAVQAPSNKSKTASQIAEDGAEPVCLTDFERLAKQRMSHLAWEYLNGAAADETTVRGNRAAYQTMRLKPGVLEEVSELDTRKTLYGQQHSI